MIDRIQWEKAGTRNPSPLPSFGMAVAVALAILATTYGIVSHDPVVVSNVPQACITRGC